MSALGADRVLLRDKTVLNPHYGRMGLYGSEYWTYVLPRRVSHDGAQRLTEECLPIGAGDAARMGLAEEVIAGTYDEFYEAVPGNATALATCASYGRLLAAKRAGRAQDEERRSLECYRSHELGEMRRDIFGDRRGFAAARWAFVTKCSRPQGAPAAVGGIRGVDRAT